MSNENTNDNGGGAVSSLSSSDLLGIYAVDGRRFLKIKQERVSEAWIDVGQIESIWDDSELSGRQSTRISTRGANWFSVGGVTPTDVALLIGPNAKD